MWLARANTQRGFTAKVADFCSQQAAAEVAAGHPARQRLNHCPPELLLEVIQADFVAASLYWQLYIAITVAMLLLWQAEIVFFIWKHLHPATRHYLDVGMQELAAVASDEAWSGSNAACAAVPAISWVKLVSDFALLVIVGGISCVCIVA